MPFIFVVMLIYTTMSASHEEEKYSFDFSIAYELTQIVDRPMLLPNYN